MANVTSDKVLLTEVLENHIVFGKRLDNLFEEKDVVMKNIAGWTLRVNLYRQSKFYQVRINIYFSDQNSNMNSRLLKIVWLSRRFGPAGFLTEL